MIMAERVMRFRRKPEQRASGDQVAARYVPGDPGSFMACLRVAQLADSASQLAEVRWQNGVTLVARYRRFYDDHPSRLGYEVVEAGRWLACSDGEFLYSADDSDWAQFYDRADGDG